MPSAPASYAFVTRSLLTRAAVLHAEIVTEMKRSSILLATGRQRRGQHPPLRLIKGGSSGDLGLITPLIAETPLCIDCIAKKSGVPVPDVASVLRRIAATFSLRDGHQCHACLRTAATFCLDGGPPKPR